MVAKELGLEERKGLDRATRKYTEVEKEVHRRDGQWEKECRRGKGNGEKELGYGTRTSTRTLWTSRTTGPCSPVTRTGTTSRSGSGAHPRGASIFTSFEISERSSWCSGTYSSILLIFSSPPLTFGYQLTPTRLTLSKTGTNQPLQDSTFLQLTLTNPVLCI